MNELEEYMSRPGFGKDDHDILRIEDEAEEVRGYLVRTGETKVEASTILMAALGVDRNEDLLDKLQNMTVRGHLVSSGVDGRKPHVDDTYVYNKSQDGSLPFRKLSSLCLYPQGLDSNEVPVYSGWYFPSWLTDKDVLFIEDEARSYLARTSGGQ